MILHEMCSRKFLHSPHRRFFVFHPPPQSPPLGISVSGHYQAPSLPRISNNWKHPCGDYKSIISWKMTIESEILKFELHSTLTFTEVVQKFSPMFFTYVKPVKINVYCLLTNEYNLNVRLNDACSTEPAVLDCTYSLLCLRRKKKDK